MGENAEGPVANDGALGEERTDCVLKSGWPSWNQVRRRVLESGSAQGQAAELPVLDEDVEEAEADDEEVDAAGFASDVEDDVDEEVDGVEDFDAAGELLDDEPRLSFR